MSTPTSRPRPPGIFDYAPKRVREQWDREAADEASDAEFAGEPEMGDQDPAYAESERDADERTSSLVPKGPHEHDDAGDGEDEDRIAQRWDGEDTHGEPEETPPRRTEDWLDELEYRAELRERRAKAAEMDREYEDQLERLSASLKTLRDEDDGESEAEPEQPLGETRRGRNSHSSESGQRDTYIDGVRLPRFLQSSYAPPPARESGSGWLGFVLSGAIACVVGLPLSYYFYAVGNPFESKPGVSLTKSDVQYSIASVSERLPKLEQPAVDASPASSRPSAGAAEPPVQPAPMPAAAPAAAPPAAQAEPSPSPQAPRRVPLTHVRWPDQTQESAPPQPSIAAPPSSRLAPASIAPPATPAPALAFAPAATPAPAALAPPPPAAARPSVDTDEVQLLLKQGQEFVAAGDLATARVVLRRAAEAGSAAAALALGQIYDPKVLTRMRARGVTPDVAQARRWYETAQRLGSGEAAQQLARLGGDE